MNHEQIAYSKLSAGCDAEKAGDFSRAIKEYLCGLEHPSEDFDTRYLLNNNLGYSLIQVGEYVEAEKYCREAISINPHRYNAHKNLGLALRGQGQYLEAANSLQLASMMSANPRARKHLDELLSEHPELKDSLDNLEVVEIKRNVIQGRSDLVH